MDNLRRQDSVSIVYAGVASSSTWST